jgi:uncharacterized membrane protein YgdD (TMEM256/DUF423 family)
MLRKSAITHLTIGALLAGSAVAAGAFGAHALKGMVTPDRLAVFETAVRYQLIHALAILIVGILLDRTDAKSLGVVAGLLEAGVAVFSGSLYVLVLLDVPIAGAVTPIGGVAMILGWLLLARWAWQQRGRPAA